jgi:hypothetical protein
VHAVEQQANEVIVSDGAGCDVIAWEDLRGGNFDIYARRDQQRGHGAVWTADGCRALHAAGDQHNSAIVADGTGGASSHGTNSSTGVDAADGLRAAVTGGRSVSWRPTGVALCTATGDQGVPASGGGWLGRGRGGVGRRARDSARRLRAANQQRGYAAVDRERCRRVLGIRDLRPRRGS